MQYTVNTNTKCWIIGNLWIQHKREGVAAAEGGQAQFLIEWVNFRIMGDFWIMGKVLNMGELLSYGWTS